MSTEIIDKIPDLLHDRKHAKRNSKTKTTREVFTL
jgi:hypothetical protein